MNEQEINIQLKNFIGKKLKKYVGKKITPAIKNNIADNIHRTLMSNSFYNLIQTILESQDTNVRKYNLIALLYQFGAVEINIKDTKNKKNVMIEMTVHRRV